MIEPKDLPNPNSERQRYDYRLPTDLIQQMRRLMQENKQRHPEICVWPSRFVETALRHFIHNFNELMEEPV
jgi:hypothetical protein